MIETERWSLYGLAWFSLPAKLLDLLDLRNLVILLLSLSLSVGSISILFINHVGWISLYAPYHSDKPSSFSEAVKYQLSCSDFEVSSRLFSLIVFACNYDVLMLYFCLQERIRRMQSVFNRERNKFKRDYERWRENGPGADHQHFQRDDWYWKTDSAFRDQRTNFRRTPRDSGSYPLSHHYSVLGLDR